MTDRAKAMDKLIAQDADLIDKLRDEDSYYRLQEKHWCIDAEELERQRLAAADRIEALEAENKRMILTIRKLQGHQAALEADNKMLREALIHTAGICNPASGFLKNTTGMRQKHLENVRDIARAALGEKS